MKEAQCLKVRIYIYKDLATSTQKRNRFEIPLLIAILGIKFQKEHFLVHKTTNLCATQNRDAGVIFNKFQIILC